jgi:hypothetical protein
MDKNQIEAMFAQAVKERMEKSIALGTKATWGMSDHLDVATKVIMAEAGITDAEGESTAFNAMRDVVQATYNHSAFAQRLEKAFGKTGHFQRDRKAPAQLSDVFAQLAAQVGEGEKKQ